MAYKTLLTVITDEPHLRPALETAMALARRENAHLDVLVLGLNHMSAVPVYPDAGLMMMDQLMEDAQADAAKLDAAARKLLEQEDIRWSLAGAAVQVGALSDSVAQRARYCDLLVMPRLPVSKATPKSQIAQAVIDAALFGADIPVLVVPPAGMPPGWGEQIVFAWNQSREAMHALRAALPLLCAAKSVSIAIIDPEWHSPERSDPGGALSQMLARHGVHAEVNVLAKALPRISDVLNRHIRDFGADTVVMGAYGHSRLRESILGGATKEMLDHAEIPVFLAH